MNPCCAQGRRFIAAALLAASAGGAHASAMITWGTPMDISADTDVSTNGSLVYAYNFVSPMGLGTTVNGVLFDPFELPDNNAASTTVGNATVTITQNNGGDEPNPTNTSSANPPFTGLSAAYQALLGEAVEDGTDIDLTLAGLTPGQLYEFQTWVSNSRNNNFPVGVGDTHSNTVTLDSNTDMGADGALGQYVTGTFTANMASQVIEFRGSEVLVVNGFQLRALPTVAAVPEPATLALLALGLAGLGTARRRQR